MPVKKYENIGVGVALSGYYRFNRFMYVGLLYQPQLLSFSNNAQFRYEHFISADVMFKIGLRNALRPKLSDRIQAWRAKRSKEAVQ